MKPSAVKIIRELRSIDADLLDVRGLEEWDSGTHPGPTFKKFSNRLSFAIADLEEAFVDDEKAELNAKRWEVLFETKGIRFAQSKHGWSLYMDYIGRDGVITGSKFLFTKPTLADLADKYLGLTG